MGKKFTHDGGVERNDRPEARENLKRFVSEGEDIIAHGKVDRDLSAFFPEEAETPEDRVEEERERRGEET
jgi:hypothetical protein